MNSARLFFVLLLTALSTVAGVWGQPLVSASTADPNAVEQSVCVEHLPGLSYAFHLIEQPRPVRVHVLKVDLSNERVEPVVVMGDTPPEEDRNAVRTDPRKLAGHPRLMALVNANPWHPWSPTYPINVSLSGLAATGGVVHSPHRGVSVWTNTQGRAFIGTPQETDIDDIQEGVGGFQQILKAEKVVVQAGGAVHPRTAFGVNKQGDRLYLVVADGRQPGFSEGMNLYELARFMGDLGCWDAANMDGGGSSVLGVVHTDGEIRILNRPPGPPGYLRPLPIVLTIRRKEICDGVEESEVRDLHRSLRKR